MRTCPRLVALVLLFAPLAAERAHADHIHESKRLRIEGAVDEAWIRRAAHLGEALMDALHKHFGRSPAAAALPLKLVLYPDETRYKEALGPASPGDRRGGEGGWTDWGSGTSHVWIQYRPFDTRRLILHELVHQFYAACRDPARRGTEPWWYAEGLAEWFGWHRLRGKQVEFGAFDLVTLNDTLHTIAGRCRSLNLRAWEVASGKAKRIDYAQALGVVAVLMDPEHAELHRRFRAWEMELLRKGGGAKAFLRHFEGQALALRKASLAFWRRHEARWKPVLGTWGEQGGIIAGAPLPSGDAFLRRADLDYVSTFMVEVEIPTGAGKAAGILVAAGKLPWGFRVEVTATHARIVRANPPGSPRARLAGSEEVLGEAPHGQVGFARLFLILVPGSDALSVELATTSASARLEAHIGAGLSRAARPSWWQVQLRKDWGLWARGGDARFRHAKVTGERNDDEDD